MCGLVGYVGSDAAAPLLLDGLARLEYRGYDSAGVAVLNGEGELQVQKLSGRVADLAARLHGGTTVPGTIGIAHTRWATHGLPTDVNAHPHADSTGRIAVIVNGIVENHSALREELAAKGHTFLSQTDVEVIPRLIEELCQEHDDVGEAVRLATRRLSGAYALVVIHADHPDRLWAARHNAPLVVAQADGFAMAASDVTAMLSHTRNVTYLEDGQLAVLGPGLLEVQDSSGASVPYETTHIEWDVTAAEKGGYAHFMLKEIEEQPHAIMDTLLDRIDVENGLCRLDGLPLDDPRIANAKRVVLLGCGTAWHSALYGASLLESWARLPASAELASEFRYGQPVVDAETLVIAVTQSGETADTLAAVKLAKDSGACVLSVCNRQGSAIPRASDGTLYTRAGIEVGVASTKAYTTQLVGLAMIALELGRRRGVLPANAAKQHCMDLVALPHAIERALELDESVAELAPMFHYTYNFLYLGRRHNWPSAAEGALKMKEISYIHATAYPGGEMKHGPIAMIEPTFPTVAIAVPGTVRDKMLSNVAEIRARRGRVIMVVQEGDKDAASYGDHVWEIPKVPEWLSPVVAAIPLQLFAYHVAVARGCDPDRPRNLAKSVTVE